MFFLKCKCIPCLVCTSSWQFTCPRWAGVWGIDGWNSGQEKHPQEGYSGPRGV